jgi:3-hydroxy acid dehydrogenase/malonic semialdehyde reductase
MLNNKTVLITGASSGIGKACAALLAKAGANLILCARRKDRLEKLSQELHQAFSVTVEQIVLDVRDQAQITQLPASLLQKIDILINNAGLARGLNKIQDGKIFDWEEMIDTNLKGLLYITHAILPFMIKKNQGQIINIGSIAGREPYPNGNVYCATKHAVHALTQCLRLDLFGTPIRVNLISPGLVETEFSVVRFHGDTDRAKLPYQGLTPLSAEDIAEAVLYCTTVPPHVNIAEIYLTPTAQANATMVHRS